MEKIKKININGNIVDIDKGCVKLVTLFNNIGIETEFCCDGHEKDNFYILFSDKVTDLDVLNIIKGCSNDDCTLLCGSFKKWIRKCKGEIISNWEYEVKDVQSADVDYDTILNNLKNIIDSSLLKNIRIYRGRFAVRIMKRKKSLSEAKRFVKYLEKFMNCVNIYEDKYTNGLMVQTYKEFKNLNEAIKMRDYLEDRILEYK